MKAKLVVLVTALLVFGFSLGLIVGRQTGPFAPVVPDKPDHLPAPELLPEVRTPAERRPAPAPTASAGKRSDAEIESAIRSVIHASGNRRYELASELMRALFPEEVTRHLRMLEAGTFPSGSKAWLMQSLLNRWGESDPQAAMA